MSGVGSQTAEAKLIQIALTLRGWSVTDLARKAKMTRTYASLLIHGRATSTAGRARIARALGMRLEEAFPESGIGPIRPVGRIGKREE